MATGKYSRANGKKSSNCLTTIIVLFVGLCLIGAWMMMSSSVEGDVSSVNVQDKGKISLKGLKNANKRTEVEGESEKAEKDGDDDGKIESYDKTEIGSENRDTDNRAEQEEEEESNSGDNNTDKASEEKKNKDDESNESKQESNEGEVGSEKHESGEEINQEAGSESKDEDDNIKHQQEKDLEKSSSTDGESIVQEVKETLASEESTSTESESIVQEVKETLASEGNTVEENSVQDSSDSNKKGPVELLNETSTQNGAWSTQSVESEKEKISLKSSKYNWKVCKVTAGTDYIPCLDNIQAIKRLPSTSHYQHRERHCPEEPPTCLVPLPVGYKVPVKWPKSREKIWFNNVPHTKLAEYKGHQNWVKVSGEYLTFPGGGTQFKNGALHYIDLIQQAVPNIAWGKRSRVILDVGCGVASFGGYLFERDVLTMSLAPKDEHEAQVQFALERGIPAISAVMGTKRLPFPSMVFDVVHCARCRVAWHIEGGKLLLELNRVLRPGGFFVWSATPVYQKLPEDVSLWKAMSKLTKLMCWELVKIGEDKLNQVAAAVYRKPTSNDCYENRPSNDPPLCEESDDPNAAWNVELQVCMHKVPTDASVRGSRWPPNWPLRVEKPPYWLKSSDVGVYGKSAPKDFTNDHEHWQHVSKSYVDGMAIDWSTVRNVMDMRALYGGFAAALKDLRVWVMNVVPIDSPDTLPIIYERGLFGIYHDWCESFSTYPRTYDLLHADHLFSFVKKRCKLAAVMAEVDRILRPSGRLIVRDKADTVSEVESMAKSLHWEIRMTYSEGNEALLCVQKTKWRPVVEEEITSAIA